MVGSLNKGYSYPFELSPLGRLKTRMDLLLLQNRIPIEFTPKLAQATAADLDIEVCPNRRDLRDTLCFTIDGEDTQDIDDAVGLRCTDDGYELSVHIADVAMYVGFDSELDAIALERGTSIYLPHQTIPMLPAVLSDNLCSLQPGQDRNALSLIISLDKQGEVKDYELTKSLIRSRVKGTYEEVNALLEGRGDLSAKAKYADVIDTLIAMREVAEKLHTARTQKRIYRTHYREPQFRIDGWEIELASKQTDAAEVIIEEFMILANRLVAEYCKKNRLPIIYRTQEEIGDTAIYELAAHHHAELDLEHYAHFTSPIRRLADLKLHQILTAHLLGIESETLWQDYGEHLQYAAQRATRCENRFEQIARSCKAFCIGAFLAPLQSNEFAATVVGHDQRDHPLFLLDNYQLCITGKTGLLAYEGQHVILKLAVIDEQKGRVEVQSFKRQPGAIQQEIA